MAGVNRGRRALVVGGTLGAAAGALGARTSLAARLLATPPQTEGPFYPDRLPLDRDNDLLTFQGERADGEPAEIVGRVLTADGRALSGVTVEIWQCDAWGYYKHIKEYSGGDPNFQGFGRTVSAADGGYRFRSIVPVPYGSRTPHVHVKVKGRGIAGLTTQLYIAGHELNARDFLFTRIPERLRDSVSAAFQPEREGGPALARFDIVLGPDFVRDPD